MKQLNDAKVISIVLFMVSVGLQALQQMIETNVSVMRIKQLIEEAIEFNQVANLTPENCNTRHILKTVMIEATAPVAFLVLISGSAFVSTWFHSNQMINWTLLVMGGLLLPITLHLFPILMFNKVMRHQNNKHSWLRAFNWLAFLAICSIGSLVGFQAVKQQIQGGHDSSLLVF